MNHGEFFVIGATHRTAPLGTRERLALTAEAEAGLAGDLAGLSGLGESVVLNTCNRVEIYGVGTGRETRGRVMAAFCARQRFALPDFEKLRLDLCGPAAVQHLLEVAAGLDSQMLGENEIFGQVKKAYAAAQTRGSAGAVLNRIFQKTFQAAKHVRTHTAITSGLVSVANVAVDLAMSIFGGLGGTHVLLLGAGEIGTKSGRAFRSRGVAGLAVASRRIEHAAEVATELGGCAQSFEEGLGRLGEFDVVVCATSAPGTVVSAEAVREAMGRRQGRPLFIIDLALPRDVDAAVAGIENVFLYNLDDLACIATKNRSAREAEIGKCRVLLRARADALWSQVAAQFAATEARAGGQMDAAYSSRRPLLAATAGCPT
jgi:glutamyl-tRNA reductase